ncbi:hypothetical protein G5B30_06795 [Sphingobacterium sp. SGG-5]|uniref:hypothetical protein n=1 Tax=Sphingobacterium sp. SGG-5 TaxID=2710881 RepID=UPI0013ED72D4|nr:hypothetical protein [Sphingobacterium sp. SGG-5]NGM61623.1 hypothetical protein [Sphingobacterium sp. SGG-5]
MKKALSFVVLFAGLGFLASAQDNTPTVKKDMRHRDKAVQERFEKKSPEEVAKIRTERLDKTLKFTDKQRQEVYAYNLDQAKKYKERAKVQKADRNAMREEMKADRERFKKLLTPDQQKILAEKYADQRNKRIDRNDRKFKGRSDGERPVRIQKDTNSVSKEDSKS